MISREVSYTTAAQKIEDRGVYLGLLALLCWAPLPLGSNRIWAIGLLILGALALLAGTIYAWRKAPHRAFERLSRFRTPIFFLGALVVIAWSQVFPMPTTWLALVSPEALAVHSVAGSESTLSLEVHQSRVLASLAFVYFTVFVVAVLTVRHRDRLEMLTQTLVWSGVFQAVLGAVLFSFGAQYRLFFFEVAHERVIGSYVYHNSLAGYLCMTLSVGIGLMLSRLGHERPVAENWKQKLTSVLRFILSPKMRLRLMLVVMVIALVLTRSRMGNAAFFASMVIVGLIAVFLSRRTAPATVGLLVSLIVIDVLVVGSWVGLEKVVERVQETKMTTLEGGKSESVEQRTQAARSSLKWVEDFALTGSGGGTFYSAYFRYREPTAGTVDFVDHAHNDFVEVAGEYGLPGFMLMGALVTASLWTAIRVLAVRRSRLPRGVAFGSTMSMVALLIHSFVDFNLQIPANALTMVVIIAMAWLAKDMPSGQRAS